MCGAFETSLFDLKRRKLISKKKSIANHKCQKAKKEKLLSLIYIGKIESTTS